MKTAVIGYGIIGRVHASHAFDLEELVAICDISKAKRDEAKRDYPSVTVYEDYEEMLKREKIEVVHICTPHYLHAEMVIEALNRGINTLCEKPLCISRDELDAVLDAEKKSTAMLGVCLQNRYNKPNVFVKNYLEGKRVLSATGFVFWKRDANYYDMDEWRGKWKSEGGGVMINQALHTLDLTAYFTKMPSFVTASALNLTHPEIEVEDSATAFFEGEVPFSFYATTSAGADFPVGIMLKTEDETITVCADKVVINGKVYEFIDESEINGKACYGTGHSKLIAHFYDCVKRGEKFAIDGEEGAKTVRMIRAIYESKGKKMKV